MRTKVDTVEQKAARIAEAQHGLVTRAQLVAACVSPSGLKRRVEKGALIRVHRGVYRAGHRAPSLEARYLAAVLACGERALLSGKGAAHLLRLTKGSAPAPEVTTRTGRRVSGIRTRRSASVIRDDGAVFRGIPVTTVPRKLVDLAAVLPVDELGRACHEAGVLYRTTPAQVEATQLLLRG